VQRITPYLLYEDCNAMLDWLSKAFGFKEVLRFENDNGDVTHAEMAFEGASIYMGDPGDDFENPRNGGYIGAQIAVEVDDVEAHFEQAKAAGAEIVREPTDQPYGDRRYDAKDPEGHLWSIAQHVRDVAAEDWGATVSESAPA
jgi:PhnB protein